VPQLRHVQYGDLDDIARMQIVFRSPNLNGTDLDGTGQEHNLE
jgi:hypothetical protein